ncbi:MAG: ABC transporter substrate-binding protein [Ruminococcus sp.]
MRCRQILSLGCAGLLLLTGCSQEPVVKDQHEQVEISFSWWGNDVRNEYTIAAVEQFEQLHPDIKVHCSYSEWSGYEARSNVRMISDTEADVMQINFAWLEKYSPDGDGYYDLNTLSDIVDLSNFTDDMLEYGRQDGKLNAIPIALNTETVYINKTIYAEYGLDVPQTWDDLFEAAEVMNGEVYPLGIASKAAWLYIMAYAEQVTGKHFLTEDGELGFAPEDIQVMLECYCELVEKKVIPQVEYFERLNLENGTYAGTVAWVSDAMAYCNGAIENGYEVVVADYTAMTAEESGEGWYGKPATMYAISKNTEHPEESALLLDYLLNSSEMAVLQGIEKGIPLSQSARECLEKENLLTGIQYEASQKMEEYSQVITQISPYAENTDFLDLFQEGCNALLFGKVSAAEQAQELYTRFGEILQSLK